jgi:hypothetical protein
LTGNYLPSENLHTPESKNMCLKKYITVGRSDAKLVLCGMSLMDAPNFSTKELNVKKLHNNGGCEVKLIL